MPHHCPVSREHEECDDAKRQTIMHILGLKITPMAKVCLPEHETISKPCKCCENQSTRMRDWTFMLRASGHDHREMSRALSILHREIRNSRIPSTSRAREFSVGRTVGPVAN